MTAPQPASLRNLKSHLSPNRGTHGAFAIYGLLRPPIQASIRPDACAHVTRTGGEEAAARGDNRAGSNGDDRVLVALEHELGMAGARVPKLDTTVLGAGEHPFRVGGERNAEDKVLYLSC